MGYKEKLSAIQWITNNQKFNEHQLIQLGDAVSAFYDCIEENEKLRELLVELIEIKEVPFSNSLKLRKLNTKLSEIKQLLKGGDDE